MVTKQGYQERIGKEHNVYTQKELSYDKNSFKGTEQLW